MHFGEIQLLISGITPRNLSMDLKEMCEAGLLEKKSDDAGYAVYVLTQNGVEFQGLVRSAKKLGSGIFGPAHCETHRCVDCERFHSHFP